MNETPNYFAILPADIRYDKRITPNAKLLYAEITALTNMNGKCFATNDYFANLYGVSKVSISKWVKELVNCGYLKSEIIYKEGSKEIDKRYLTFVKDPIKENFNTPIKEKFKENNTTIVEYNNNLTDSNIKDAFDKWVAYKKERKQSYTATGLKQCAEKLSKLSNNNPDIAMQIVNESISNNWSGLFPLKNEPTPQNETGKKVWIEVGHFYIDELEKNSPGFSDLVVGIPQERRDCLWYWFMSKFRHQEIDLSLVRKILTKARGELC